MADDPTLPFSALNQQPGVSGLQDVDLPIGDIQDDLQDILESVNTIEDIVEIFDGELGEVFDDVFPIGDFVDAIDELFEGPDGPSTGAGINAISQLVTGQIELVLNELQNTEDQIIGALSGELEDISVTVESIEIDEDEIADEIEDELEIPGDGGTIISFDSVFGAVASTIEESFELVLTDLIGNPADLPDGINTVVGALAALLEQIGQQPELPDIPGSSEISSVVVQELVNLPGGDILGDPNQFVDSQIDRVTFLPVSWARCISISTRSGKSRADR